MNSEKLYLEDEYEQAGRMEELKAQKQLESESWKIKVQPFAKKAIPILLVFIFLCMCTAAFFDSNIYSQYSVQPSIGGTVGPVTTTKDNSVVSVLVSKPLINSGEWTVINGDVLDKNKNYLFSFGKELWDEEGTDSDGYWHESENNYEAKFNLNKGTYFLEFDAEDSWANNDEIDVKISQKQGSSLIFNALSIITFILCGICTVIGYPELLSQLADD